MVKRISSLEKTVTWSTSHARGGHHISEPDRPAVQASRDGSRWIGSVNTCREYMIGLNRSSLSKFLKSDMFNYTVKLEDFENVL